MKKAEEIRLLLGEPFKKILAIITLEMQEAYDNGKKDGIIEGNEEAENSFNADDLEDVEIEKIGCNFVVEKFKDCKTLEEFKDAYKWIETRSFNFMRS